MNCVARATRRRYPRNRTAPSAGGCDATTSPPWGGRSSRSCRRATLGRRRATSVTAPRPGATSAAYLGDATSMTTSSRPWSRRRSDVAGPTARETRLRAGVLEDVRVLEGVEPCIDRHDGAAGPPGAVEDLERTRAGSASRGPLFAWTRGRASRFVHRGRVAHTRRTDWRRIYRYKWRALSTRTLPAPRTGQIHSSCRDPSRTFGPPLRYGARDKVPLNASESPTRLPPTADAQGR